MSARVHSVTGQTEGRNKAFLEWTSINLSFKLSLTCGGNVNIKGTYPMANVTNVLVKNINMDIPIDNEIITINTVKEFFQEMFKEQQKALLNIVSTNTTPLQKSLDRLSIQIQGNSNRLENIIKETDDLKLSLEVTQEMQDVKIKSVEKLVKEAEKKYKQEIESLIIKSKEQNDKLRVLEDRSRRDNLRFDGIPEYKNETWADTEDILKDTLREQLGMNNIKIERAHRTGTNTQSTCRTIIAKFTSYKTKERILKEHRNQKPKDIEIYEDFSKETVKIRKELWEKVRELRSQNKYAILVYDKIYTCDTR